MTIKEIAQLAGVSVSTVSKVMNNKDSSISAETRERVLQTAKQFNYVPYAGSATGDTKSFLLGVILSSPNALKMIDGILDAAQAQGHHLQNKWGSGRRRECHCSLLQKQYRCRTMAADGICQPQTQEKASLP